MRPRGESISSPQSKYVGHVGRQNPQWTHLSISADDGLSEPVIKSGLYLRSGFLPDRTCSSARVPRPPRLTRVPRHRRVASARSEEHTSELQSLAYLVCRLLL